jgi:tyrosine-protein phosphatase YwqE
MINLIKQLFNTNNSKELPYLVDIHSHLIPAIDDGAKDMQSAVELIRGVKELGFKKLITTPHTMSHRFKNSSKTILNGFESLKNELQQQNIDIEIEVASEYYLDEHFFDLLAKKDILTFGENYLLFEHAYGIKPLHYESLIFEIKVAGYRPVLAHPERYLFMHNDFALYERLKELGVYFQINLNSLGGYYSKDVQKVAHKLVERGWIDFIGSDMHHKSHLQHFSKNLHSKNLAKVFKYNTILNQQLL